MSHFTVMVIGENPEDQLKPFDENLNEEWKDQAEEFKLQYETEEVSEFYCESSSSWGFQITKELFDFIKSHKAGAIKKYVVEKQLTSYLTNGKKYRGYYTTEKGARCDGDAWFEVVAVNETNHPEKNICFQGVVTIMVINPPKEIKLKDKYPDYDTYLSDWHGIKNKEKQGYWHNPNAKWDWYELGGRWTGFFKVKEGVFEITGNPGLMTKPAKDGYADVALKEEIDFEYMRNEAADKAAKKYEKAMAIFEGLPENETWDVIKNNTNDISEARTKYWDQPRCKAWTDEEKKDYANFPFAHNESPDDFLISKYQYMHMAAEESYIPFAVVKDGQWYEKGKMGWFACVHDEMDEKEWISQVSKMIDELEDKNLISVFDCHI